MKLLTEKEVRQCLTAWAAIDASKEAFVSLERKSAVVPQRALVSTPQESITLFKPGYIPGQSLGLKVIGVRPANAEAGLPTTPAVVLLFAEDTGLPLACMPATYLTALRTAAGSAIASDLCAPATVNHLLVVGAGLQAEAHIMTHFCVRDIRQVTIVNRNVDRAHELVKKVKLGLQSMLGLELELEVELGRKVEGEEGKGKRRVLTKNEPRCTVVGLAEEEKVKEALGSADIVCMTTAAPTPLLDGQLLRSGCHVNAVGSYQPHTREVDSKTVARASVILDTEEALSSGDLAIPLAEGCCKKETHVKGTLGKLLLEGPAVRNTFDKAITLFKSVGTAAQDLTTAAAVLRGCERSNLGYEHEMFPAAT